MLKKLKGFFSLSWPKFSQWQQFFKVLSKKEKIVFLAFFFLFLISAIFLVRDFYLENTQIQPKIGGFYREGVLGNPRFINPIYAIANDPDRDLAELLFSGLMKFDSQGKLVPDLAKRYEIKEEGKVYIFYLKENLFWSDGKPLKADDVIFTLETIQNPDYKSPLRANWLGVEIEKIDDLVIKFQLKNPYPGFLERTTQKIMPAHIWKAISPQNFPLAIYQLWPIGSGPYKLVEAKKDKLGYFKSLTLVRNPHYFGKGVFLSKIIFQFYPQEEDLIKAGKKKKIDGFSILSPKNYSLFKKAGFEDYHFLMPRYFALFFNPEKSKVLAEKNVRQALNYGTNKEEIVEKIFAGQAKVIHSPILPELLGFPSPSKIYQFDLEKAKSLLEEAGFKKGEGTIREKILKKKPAFQFKSNLQLGSRGKEVEELQRCLAKDSKIYPQGEISGYFGKKTEEAVMRFQEKYKKEILDPWGFKKGTGLVSRTTRAKLNEICFGALEESLLLKFSLVTVDQPILVEVANLLKKQWQNLGVEVEIKKVDISQLEEDFIKPRNYESLLFGQILGSIPDLFPFWHSSQKRDPGLNLAIYGNKKADQLLEETRRELQPAILAKKLAEFQEILIEDAPAIFLYSPDYLYFLSKEIKGIKIPPMITDPAKRFSGIEDWYIKTKRVWK